eukprot:TRINITY_DN525_c0_g1_i1.p1 TRINITY_DN525_c0_g1~~TRINITY_DN525_c0_g1_i1.p1  ORF type:complete len:456 (+),score=116.55 TRINITY_DN525_c0_g1_i1:11-1378(+)
MRRAASRLLVRGGGRRCYSGVSKRSPQSYTTAQVVTVMGSQWGDEGKGKLVDVLGADFDIIARCAGGSNAGHTVVVEGKKYAFNLMPSGILHERTTCLIGNGVVLHVPTLFKELESLEKQNIRHEGRIKVSDRAHLVFDFLQEVDGAAEESAAKSGASIGTTKKGIGPTYMSKCARTGIRVGDLFYPEQFETKFKKLVGTWSGAFPSILSKIDVKKEVDRYLNELFPKIKPMIVDSVEYVNREYKNGKRIMVEGANATMLDIDFGTYPYVTSSSCSVGGAVTGLGLSPDKIGSVVGIMKAYTTRVGAGPFPTELNNALGDQIRSVGREFGTVTGRPRRCGWLDAVVMKYTHLVNNFTVVNMTKLDVLSELDEIQLAVEYKHKGKTLSSFPSSLEVLQEVEVVYEKFPGWKCDISKIRKISELPPNAFKYVKRVEEIVGAPIGWVGVGPGREAMAQ